MITFLYGIGIGLCVLVLCNLYRGVFGPGVFNRIAAISAVGTKALILLLIIGFMYQREDMFIDISMVYALLNFVGTVAAAKYLEMED